MRFKVGDRVEVYAPFYETTGTVEAIEGDRYLISSIGGHFKDSDLEEDGFRYRKEYGKKAPESLISPEEANLALLKANIVDLALELEKKALKIMTYAVQGDRDLYHISVRVSELRNLASRLKEMV